MEDWVAGTPSKPGRNTRPVRSWRISSAEACATPNLRRKGNLIGPVQHPPSTLQRTRAQQQVESGRSAPLCSARWQLEMHPTRLAQTQCPGRRTDQVSRQGTEIRFVTDQQNAALREGKQSQMIATWNEPIGHLRRRCQASTMGQVGSLKRAAVRTADQPFCPDPALGQMLDHSFGALPPPERERAVRVIQTMATLLGDAMAQQEQVNPG